MATPEQIPSDLTLEIDGNLSPDRFLSAVRAFFGYVQEVSKTVADGVDVPDWTVRVREGSQLIGVDPGPTAQFATVRAVYAAISTGVSSLTVGSVEGASLSDPAIRYLKTLSEISERQSDRPTPVRLWVEKKPTYLGGQIAETIREDWRGNFKDFGSLEGKLHVIQDRGRIQLRVRDTMLNQSVRCNIPEKMLDKALENFRQRVEVYGIIHYKKDGHPISIEVQTIDRLDDDADLPTLDDVLGILRPEA